MARICYNDIPNTSYYKLMKCLIADGYKHHDIKEYSYHKLKQLYNRKNNKYNRLFDI